MKNFKGMNLYAKGRRSYIFVKKIHNKKIAFKVVINKKRTKDVIKNEYKYLKILCIKQLRRFPRLPKFESW